MLTSEQLEKTRKWIYENARPLDLARWKYHFENGSKTDVLNALNTFKNSDGGFGNALEADCWNTESSPMQTWVATEVLLELGITESHSQTIRGILSYLENCPYFIDGKWIGTIPSNNDYPHAEWWSFSKEMVDNWNYNPSACLAGFVLLHGERGSSIYKRAEYVAKEAASWFLKQVQMDSMHETFCFMRLWEYCNQAEINYIFDTNAFEIQLRRQISSLITQDKNVWQKDYICKPSQFFNSKDSIFYRDNKPIADYEAEFIVNTVNDEGVWDITWNWDNYPREWGISKEWWKATYAIRNLLYLRGTCKL